MNVVVMGVSGCGKSTIGRAIADRLGVEFLDGDDFHPPENVARMSSGIPLTDDDRRPWLERLASEIGRRREVGVVVACSALKESYREILRSGDPALRFVWLDGSREVILERMQRRRGHYMRPEMLDSQLATLEPPGDAIRVSIAASLGEVLDGALRGLNSL